MMLESFPRQNIIRVLLWGWEFASKLLFGANVSFLQFNPRFSGSFLKA